jgi:hypothetical protein
MDAASVLECALGRPGAGARRGLRMTMHRAAGIPILLFAVACLVAAAGAQESATPQQQVDGVVRQGLLTAKTQLEQEFSFLPFAVLEHADGRIETLLGPTGDELDPLDTPELQADPARALEQLQRRVEREAKTRGDLRVIGIFSDDDVKLPDGTVSDAIQAEMEHVSGYCKDIFLPYGREVNNLTYGQEISTPGKGLVFRCK